MKFKFVLNLICFLSLGLLLSQKVKAQCPQIESILVDACDTGADEGLNEMVRFKVGATALNLNAFSVNWPSNNWEGLVKNALTASKVATLNAQINTAGGCGKLIEPTGNLIPANAKVILVTSYNFNIALNYFGAISEDIYIIFQDNAAVTIGHFGNYASTSGLRTLAITFGSGCNDSVTYQRTLLKNINGGYGPAFPDPTANALNDGATVNFTPAGIASYVNNGCVAPVDVLSVDAGNSTITACPGATISLLGIALGQQSVGWSAASGTFSSSTTLGTNYTIDPLATGAITLTLKATNSCGKDKTDTIVVNINSGSSPIINCGTATSSSVQFTWPAVIGASGYSVSYQIGSGTPTASVNIGNVLNYTVSGLSASASVTITVLPIGGAGTCFLSSSKTCTTTGCITPVLSITNPSSVCSPATVNITLASVIAGTLGSGTLSYWTNAAATIALTNPAAITTSGTYYIKSTSGACFDIKPVTVTINSVPVLNISNPVSVCSPAAVDLTLASVTAGSTGSGILSYWTNPAATLALTNPSVVTTSGTYYIKSTSGTCFDIKPVTVTINSTPVLSISNPVSVCSPATVDITAAPITSGSTGSVALSYWTNSAATIALANPSAIATSGTYYVKSTSGTCLDIKPVTVTISSTPVLSITNPASVCSPATVNITAAAITAGSTGPGTLSYWTNAAATIALTNPSAIAASGTYFIKSTNGICFDIKPVVVSVISSFDFDISGSCVKGSFTLESKPISNSYDSATATFQWKDQLGNSIGSNESTLDVSKALANTSVVEEFPLTYSLEITPVGGCPASKSYIISGVICSIPKGISPDGNSKNDEFDLTGLGVKELHIFNRYGKEVYNYTNYTKQWHGQTNGGEELPDGTYFYSIHKGDGTSTTGWVYINRKQ